MSRPIRMSITPFIHGNATVVSFRRAQLKYIFNECGSYYVTLRVDTRDASTEEEIRVDVNELAPPVISLVTPSIGLKLSQDVSISLHPTFKMQKELLICGLLTETKSERKYLYIQAR